MSARISRKEIDAAFDERFPPQVKQALNEARVAVAGLGGLGSHIAVMLARSGVGHLLLVDFDTVDVTNLNRQAYGIRHIGMAKTDAMRDILKDINPYLDVRTERIRVASDSAVELFAGWPLVCEAFDLPDQKAMLISALLAGCPDTMVVSGSGMAGYADAGLIRTERRLRRLYVCGDQVSDTAEGLGLMAPRVAVCAGHQANKIIQLILEGVRT